ncbi:MAG: cellulose biosynthesis cyclic di-GMP-binding regulatory protein BcsB [Rhodosalinus sp.]
MTRRLPPFGRTLAVALVAGLAGPVHAQIIPLDPPEDQAPAPPENAPPRSTAPRDPADRGRTQGPAADTPAPEQRAQLVPLRAAEPRIESGPIRRLAGEAATARFVLYLPSAPGETELALVHRSGIDALPERSRLAVRVNRTDLGTLAPDNFEGFARDTLAVPEGGLRAGRNEVTIIARHTHRVACGPDAAFALWTEIDPRASGVSLSTESFGTDADGFLAAISAQAARGAPIHIKRPDPQASLVEAAPFIAEVARALGGTPPAVESVGYWRQSAGPPDLARITALPPGRGPDEPRFARGGDGALVLLLEQGTDYAQVSAGLADAAGGPDQTGLAVATPGSAQALSDLGAGRLVGEGRYIRIPVDFRLPWDWVLLASQKARLDLDYRFAEGLPEGALLLVKVNGTTIRLLPLDRDGGRAQPTLPISFGARLLEPGVNRLEFEALIPGDPPDAACEELDGPVLEISEGSQLFVPTSPRMSLPSLDLSLSALAGTDIVPGDEASGSLPPGLLPQVAAALAAPGGSSPDDPLPRARLTVGTPSDLSGIEAPLVRDNLRALTAALDGVAEGAGAPVSAATPWDEVSEEGGWFGLPTPGEIAALPARLAGALERLAFGETVELGEWLTQREAQAALLQPDPDRPGDIWLVLGRSARPDEIVRALAGSRDSRDGPSGQVALYEEATGWVSWTAPDRTLKLHEPLKLSNLRAVMGNHATLAPLGYVAAILALTVLSALVAMAILVLTRRNDE